MIVKELNKENDWGNIWTDELKAELFKGQDNEIVAMKLLRENETFKIWSIILPPGQSLPFHKHCKPYFYVSKNYGKSRSFYSTGKVIETEYNMDDVKYFSDLNNKNYFIHNLINIGDTTLLFTTVEFKI